MYKRPTSGCCSVCIRIHISLVSTRPWHGCLDGHLHVRPSQQGFPAAGCDSVLVLQATVTTLLAQFSRGVLAVACTLLAALLAVVSFSLLSFAEPFTVCCLSVDGQTAGHGSCGKVRCVEASNRFVLPMASGRACAARCCCVWRCAVCSRPAAQRPAGHSVCSAVSAARMQRSFLAEQ